MRSASLLVFECKIGKMSSKTYTILASQQGGIFLVRVICCLRVYVELLQYYLG